MQQAWDFRRCSEIHMEGMHLGGVYNFPLSMACHMCAVCTAGRLSFPKKVVRRAQPASLRRRSRLVVVELRFRGDGGTETLRNELRKIRPEPVEVVHKEQQHPEFRTPHKEGWSEAHLEDNLPQTTKEEQDRQELQARILLLLVPLMWATYAPSLRFIYAQPLALSPSMLTFARKVCSLVCFFYVLPLERLKDETATSEGVPQGVWSSGGGLNPDWAAAVELGLWTFLGTALQTTGLESTTATRASFLLQSTTIFVPLIAALFGGKVSSTMWGAATMALLGVSIMTLSRGEGSLEDMLSSLGSGGYASVSLGDIGVLVAAACYALATVRLSFHASQLSAVRLTGNVMVVSAILSLAWVLLDISRSVLDGRELGVGSLGLEGLGSSSVIAAIVFSAFVPGTLASLAQTYGQKTIPASQAQVYYSFHPLWSAAFAFILLDERMSSLGWVGGMMVLAAALLSSNDTRRNRDDPAPP